MTAGIRRVFAEKPGAFDPKEYLKVARAEVKKMKGKRNPIRIRLKQYKSPLSCESSLAKSSLCFARFRMITKISISFR